MGKYFVTRSNDGKGKKVFRADFDVEEGKTVMIRTVMPCTVEKVLTDEEAEKFAKGKEIPVVAFIDDNKKLNKTIE